MGEETAQAARARQAAAEKAAEAASESQAVPNHLRQLQARPIAAAEEDAVSGQGRGTGGR